MLAFPLSSSNNNNTPAAAFNAAASNKKQTVSNSSKKHFAPAEFQLVSIHKTTREDGARVPLNFSKQSVVKFGSDEESCQVVMKGTTTEDVVAKLQLTKDGFMSLHTVADGKQRQLKAGEEFFVEGKLFRLEKDENSKTSSTSNNNVDKVKSIAAATKSVKFNQDSAVRILGNGSYEIGTPKPKEGSSSVMKAVAAVKLRNSTPYVQRPRFDLDTSVTDIDSVDDKSKIEEITRQIVRTSKALAAEQRLKTPLLTRDLLKLQYVAAANDPIPASVRKFMTSRAKKPALKALRPFPAASEHQQATKAPTPLRAEIQRHGARLNARREALLDRISDFDLEPASYALWTVDELEQRVLALEEEERRAGVEALLVECGHNPRDFAEYTSNEIESWLEKELAKKKHQSTKKQVVFQGVLTTFESPAVSRSTTPVAHDSMRSEATVRTPLKLVEEQLSQLAIQSNWDVKAPSTVEMVVPVTVASVENSKEVAVPAEANTDCTNQTLKVVIPKPDPMQMTCEQIRAELKTRGLKVSGLKSVIAERLAQAMAQEAEKEEEMLTQGHEFIGRKVERVFESGTIAGTVEAFLPGSSNDEDATRFYVVHEDGDYEILDLEDTKTAIEAASQ